MISIDKLENPLKGIRVWLSGSIPDDDSMSDEQKANAILFIRELSREVFRNGGRIIHGAHPSITIHLIQESDDFRKNTDLKTPLTIVASRFFFDKYKSEIESYSSASIFHETPAASEHEDNRRDQSLAILREWMVARADVLVAIGGKEWIEYTGRAGVNSELNLGFIKGIPCFVLGGFGGNSSSIVKKNILISNFLRNGLSAAQNFEIANNTNPIEVARIVTEQMKRLPINTSKGSTGSTFRILSLDGGGIKGTFTAAVLTNFEKQTGYKIHEHFDLITGTSTGGILALGLAAGIPAEKLLDFYRNKGPVIFPMTRVIFRVAHFIKHFVATKFSSKTLYEHISNAYKNETQVIQMDQLKTRVVIPSFHALTGLPYIFRTPHHKDLTADKDTKIAEVALATSAAPTYFKAAKIWNNISTCKFLDGGVWANSPSLVAIIEANHYIGVPIDRIDILSIGTTEEPSTFKKLTESGAGKWAITKKILEIFMHAQQKSSVDQAELLVGKSRFKRINITANSGEYSLDNASQIEELASRGKVESDNPEHLREIKSRFLNGDKINPWK